MNRRQAESLRKSFRWFEPCGAAMIAKMLRNLGDHHPGIRALFPDDSAHLNGRFFETLGQVVSNIDAFHRIEGPLGELGRAAAREGANAGHYRVIKRELMSVMAELAGEDWSPELGSLWSETLDAITGAMLAGAITAQELRRAA